MSNERIVENSNQIITGFGNKIKKHDEQFISKASILNSLDWINVVSLGVDNSGFSDCSPSINEIINNNQGKTIYLPKGKYKILSPVTINNVDFICDGEIIIGDNIGLNLISSYSKVSIKKIIGSDYTNKKGIALKIGSDIKVYTNSHITIGMISECETALLLNPNNNYGVQCSTFEFDNLSRCTYGIKIQGGDNSTPWVNENKFICRGSLNCKYGIYTKKGLNMVDPYNGNKFVNMSIEQGTYPFILEFANSNVFENFRCVASENTFVDYIINLKNCRFNTFSTNNPTSITYINDVNGYKNTYKMTISDTPAGTEIGKELIIHNNNKYIYPSIGDIFEGSEIGAYNKIINTSDYIKKISVINMSCDANQNSILILDDRYGVNGSSYNEFIVNVTYIGSNGVIQIKNQSGLVLLDQTKLSIGKHLIKFIAGNWYSFKAN